MRNMARAGNISGLLVFFVGICHDHFHPCPCLSCIHQSGQDKDLSDLIPGSEREFEGAVKALGYVVAIGLLWVMGSLAGRIVGHGIGMFKARPSAEGDKEP